LWRRTCSRSAGFSRIVVRGESGIPVYIMENAANQDIFSRHKLIWHGGKSLVLGGGGGAFSLHGRLSPRGTGQASPSPSPAPNHCRQGGEGVPRQAGGAENFPKSIRWRGYSPHPDCAAPPPRRMADQLRIGLELFGIHTSRWI
jgi:hypothetical protein